MNLFLSLQRFFVIIRKQRRVGASNENAANDALSFVLICETGFCHFLDTFVIWQWLTDTSTQHRFEKTFTALSS